MLNSRFIAAAAYTGDGGRRLAIYAIAKTIAVGRGWPARACHDDVKDHS
jgi:hypothetical protein